MVKLLTSDNILIAIWKREKLSSLYMLCSIALFFVMGVSFVFVMDYAITMSGKLFNFPRKTSSETVSEDSDCDTKYKLLKGECDVVKIPFRDGPEIHCGF